MFLLINIVQDTLNDDYDNEKDGKDETDDNELEECFCWSTLMNLKWWLW